MCVSTSLRKCLGRFAFWGKVVWTILTEQSYSRPKYKKYIYFYKTLVIVFYKVTVSIFVYLKNLMLHLIICDAIQLNEWFESCAIKAISKLYDLG